MREEISVGWIGCGRMGYAMVSRLLKGGYRASVWNRTRAKAEPLEELGATVVDRPSDLARNDVVFTMVSTGSDLREVLFGADGLLRGGVRPRVIVDSSTVDIDEGEVLRTELAEMGIELLAAPVSGNAKAVEAGEMTMVVSGPEDVFEAHRRLLELQAKSVTYSGGGDLARLVKVCHNLLLGAVTQSLAEIAVLAEKGGVSRAAVLEFINSSVMGSVFTKYKTPAFVNLDFEPTFTPVLLRKDFELGLSAARKHEVPMPLHSLIHQQVHGAIAEGFGDVDFAILLAQQARNSGITLTPENTAVSDGLEPATE